MSSRFRFLHVSLTKPEKVTVDRLAETFNGARDWARYSQGNWIVYTNRSVDYWRDRIHGIPGMENQNIFVCEFDQNNSSGYLPQWLWEWLNKERPDQFLGEDNF
jgi:hypothetical protein